MVTAAAREERIDDAVNLNESERLNLGLQTVMWAKAKALITPCRTTTDLGLKA